MSLSKGIQSAAAAALSAAMLIAVAACGTTDSTDTASKSGDSSKDSSSTSIQGFDTSSIQKDDEIAALLPDSVAGDGTLTVGTDTSYAPAEFLAEDGKTPVGFDVDLSKAIAAVFGLKEETISSTFDSIIPSVGSKYDLGISSFTVTKERMQAVDFVTYFKAGSTYVVQKGNPNKVDSSNLCGVKVAVQTGTTQEEEVNKANEQCKADGNSAEAQYVQVGTGTTTTSDVSVTYVGGTSNLTVPRLAVTYPGSTTPETVTSSWTAQPCDEEGNPTPSDWLTLTTATADGGGSITMQAAPQTGYAKPMKVDLLVHNYDLSTQGGRTARNTANCYLVHATGTYTLPLVYGNAIKDGADNKSAYTSTATGDNALSPFINHLGVGITDPYIKNNNITLTEAKLLWQDVEGMIDPSSVSISGDNLTFRVTDKIDYGNAVLAVYDNQNPKQIAWSWHIWTTDYKLGTDLIVTDGAHKILPHHLGWVPGPEYEARSQHLLLTEAGTGATVVVTVDQAAYKGMGNHPFYQYGRKDPQLPSDGTTNTNKTWYNEMGTPSTDWDYQQLRTTENQLAEKVIMACIQNPMTFSYGVRVGTTLWSNLGKLDGQYANLWAANSGLVTAGSYLSESTKKTVYDPCPAGYKVPVGYVLDPLIVSTGTWSTAPAGRYFDCTDESGNPATVFFPASGWRSSSTGMLGDVGIEGSSWMAETQGITNGYIMTFVSGNIRLQNDAVRSNGIPVRPEKE